MSSKFRFIVHKISLGNTTARNSCGKSSSEIYINWNIENILNFGSNEKNEKYSFIILNTPIVNPEIVVPLWKRATFKITVDGGANHLYALLNQYKREENYLLPSLLTGDFDSIKSDVLKFYRDKNVQIICTPDQFKTDFFKALEILCEKSDSTTVLVYGNSVGRFDQIMANINTLYIASNDSRMKHLKIVLLGDNHLSLLLKDGKHLVHIPKKLWTEKSYCGLIPVGHACHRVKTSGLKWNLDNETLEFGGKVSSSNTYDVRCSKSVVHIMADDALLWTMTISVP